MIFKLLLLHPEDIGGKLKLVKKVDGFTMTTYYPEGSPRPKIQEAYEFTMTKKTKGLIKRYSLQNLAVMRTCQLIYEEAARVLWGQTFTFRTITHLQTFLLLSELRLDLVRGIRIRAIDQHVGINYMPAMSFLVADKLKGLESFEIDMSHLRDNGTGWDMSDFEGFKDDEHLKMAGKNLGFGIYSSMYPWVTKVVREEGIDRLI